MPEFVCALRIEFLKGTIMMEEKEIIWQEAFQAEIQKLEAYYTSPQWKADFAADEAGQYPEKLKRGVLSEDGIWNMLERNRELLHRLGISEVS